MTTTEGQLKLPTGVEIIADADAKALWAQSGSAIDDDTAASMIVVEAKWGRNATTELDKPHKGIGKGYTRPFISDDPMTCRVCRTHMTAQAFPSLSVPAADGRTRKDKCRACAKAKVNTKAEFDKLPADKRDRSKWAIVEVPAAVEPPATGTKTRAARKPKGEAVAKSA